MTTCEDELNCRMRRGMVLLVPRCGDYQLGADRLLGSRSAECQFASLIWASLRTVGRSFGSLYSQAQSGPFRIMRSFIQ